MLQMVRSAAELADAIFRLTENFPPEEQYVMVPTLRDTSLTILEYASLGMARYDSPYRYILLSRALVSLNELSSHFVLCKRIGLMSRDSYKELTDTAMTLRDQLLSAIQSVGQADPDLTPPF
jgi:four helix bundle protein